MAEAEQVLRSDHQRRVHRTEIAAVPSWHSDLSPRDLNVLRLLSEGRSTGGIAEDLAYSESTIKNVIHDLVRQLGARNRAHAVAMAIRAGII